MGWEVAGVALALQVARQQIKVQRFLGGDAQPVGVVVGGKPGKRQMASSARLMALNSICESACSPIARPRRCSSRVAGGNLAPPKAAATVGRESPAPGFFRRCAVEDGVDGELAPPHAE